jgi:transposase
VIKLHIGMDTHKENTVVSSAATGGGDALVEGKCSSDVVRLEKFMRKVLKKHGLTKDEVRICYEAGPCGFVIARHFIRLGFDIIVVAPSLVPERKGQRVKTDKRDARKLAHSLRAGDLKGIHIPDVSDEVLRDLCRARTDAVDDSIRNRQRLLGFLLRNGHNYTGRSNWTEAHMRYLRELVLQDAVQKLILEEYLMAVDAGQERVKGLEDHIHQKMGSWERLPFVKALQGLKGFQFVSSMVVTSELGDITRFSHPRKLMGFLGLVSSEDTSGEHRRQGPITKCGNSHVRWMLVEIAGSYRYPPKVSKELSVRQEGLAGPIKELSWRAQKRLHKRFVRLTMRRLHPNKIKVAIARELCAFIWELAHIMKELPA